MKKKRLLSALMAAAILAAQCFLPASESFSPAPEASAAVTTLWSVNYTGTRSLADGLTQAEFVYTTAEGVGTSCIALRLSPDSAVSLRPAMPEDGDDIGLDTVRDMANSAVLHGDNVVAAVNGDMYNTSTGEPWGVVYYRGNVLHGYNVAGRDWLYFGLTKDGGYRYGGYADYQQNWPQLESAMGLHCVLVENGKNVCADKSSTRAPRTAVGVRSDGTVFFLVTDGRSGTNSGLSLTELADLMIRQGAVWAGNLDGGGSSTVVSREPGADKLTVQNNPSDGAERRVANAWLFVGEGSPTAAQTSAAGVSLHGFVVSDTTRPVTIAAGQSYQFRMTLAEGSNPPDCYLSDRTYFDIAYTGNSGRDYFYKVTAKANAPAGASTAIYSFLPNQAAVKQCEIAA